MTFRDWYHPILAASLWREGVLEEFEVYDCYIQNPPVERVSFVEEVFLRITVSLCCQSSGERTRPSILTA